MDTGHFSIRVDLGPPMPIWTIEQSARLLAVETFEHHNVVNGYKRLVTPSVALLRDGAVIDRLDDTGWLSQRLV